MHSYAMRLALVVAAVLLLGACDETECLAFGIGAVSGRISLRYVIAAAAVIGAVGIYLSRFISSAWHLYLTFGVLVSVGVTRRRTP